MCKKIVSKFIIVLLEFFKALIRSSTLQGLKKLWLKLYWDIKKKKKKDLKYTTLIALKNESNNI